MNTTDCYRCSKLVEPRLGAHSWGQERHLFLVFQILFWSSKYILTRRNGATGKCIPSYTQHTYKLLESNLLIIGGLPVWFWVSLWVGQLKVACICFSKSFFPRSFSYVLSGSLFFPIDEVFGFMNKGILTCHLNKGYRHQINTYVTRIGQRLIFLYQIHHIIKETFKQKVGGLRPSS